MLLMRLEGHETRGSEIGQTYRSSWLTPECTAMDTWEVAFASRILIELSGALGALDEDDDLVEFESDRAAR